MARSSTTRSCLNPACSLHGIKGAGNIRGHGSFKTRSGRHRRWSCVSCDTTFSTNTGTPYHRLRGSRQELDAVVTLRVEGLSKSAIARVARRARNTIARWLERAAATTKHFNDVMLDGFELLELQVDELCTFAGRKENLAWVFAAIEVSSRLWPSSCPSFCLAPP